MKFYRLEKWKFVCGLILGAGLATGLTAIDSSLSKLSQQRSELFVFMSRTDQDDSFWMTARGEPTSNFKDVVARASGAAITALVVSTRWQIAQRIYGLDPVVESQWKALGAQSVKDFDRVEWPTVAFANLPWRTASSEIIKVVDGLRRGVPFRSPQDIENERIWREQLLARGRAISELRSN